MSAYLAGLPSFFLQSGDFALSQRAACFLSKASLFTVLGGMTSAGGSLLSKGLVEVRTKLQPDNVPEVELAPILDTSKAYAVFMAGSSNTRCASVGVQFAPLPLRDMSGIPP